MNGRHVLVVTGLLTVTAVAAAGAMAWLGSEGIGPVPLREQCLAKSASAEVELDLDQARNAAVIAGIATRRGLPVRAVTIALATAYQESDLRNLNHGDRDSLGLFQQRPSQGWGTAAQVRDPHYAAGKFYDALVKIKNYEKLAITVAADKVQRSAFPNAYADHADDAAVISAALTGQTPAAFSCVVRHSGYAPEQLGANGLTPRAEAVRKNLIETFGKVPTGGFAAGGVRTGHMEGSAHYEGRAVDVFVRPINTANTRKGWAYANYLVAHAEQLGITTVIFSDRIWTSGTRSSAGWRDYKAPQRAGNTDTLRHLDHVHVDVAED
ncbi:hypothetical protein [Kribbella deserti]|uniref:ARB-07466-like C-terminal domain-containing protein n=1 Tax=Kribbella deserti TaxID=1926257 RepID=A0ABV6QWZ1_9ACTN